MDNLTNKQYWDDFYKNLKKSDGKSFFQKYFPQPKVANYSNYLLWNDILSRYLPKERGLKILEIGSAPGGYLINFHKKFSYLPYGVENSDEGYKINCQKFENAELDPKNIINADVFSGDFQKKYGSFFDIVYSRGFIEHFEDTKKVITCHLNLLKKGGTLVIIIPNLRGLNFYLANFFNKESLKKHNLKIMDKKIFYNIFCGEGLKTLFCDYYGVFNFGLFNTINIFAKFLHRICMIFQYLLNFIFRTLFKNKPLEHRYFSPYLIYIGRKK